MKIVFLARKVSWQGHWIDFREIDNIKWTELIDKPIIFFGTKLLLICLVAGCKRWKYQMIVLESSKFKIQFLMIIFMQISVGNAIEKLPEYQAWLSFTLAFVFDLETT